MDAAQRQELFGSDSEEEDEPAEAAAGPSGDGEATGSADAGAGEEIDEADLFGSEDEEDGAPAGRRAAAPAFASAPPLHYELPILPRPKPDAEIYLMKIPNILGIEPRPFIAEEYDPDAGVDPDAPQEEKKDNVIRWRENADGKVESNARFVTWSDGSMTLHVGGEVLSAVPQKVEAGEQLFARHKGSNLECHGMLRKKLILQPASIKSSTHRALTQRIAKSVVQERKIKMVTTTADPEKEKREAERSWDDKQRELMRGKTLRSQDYAGGGGQELSEAFLDDDDDVGEGNLGAIKRRFSSGKDKKKAAKGGQGGGKRMPPRAAFGGKRPRALSSGRNRDEDDSEDEEDEEEEEDGDPAEMDGFIVRDEEAEASDSEEEAEESDEGGGDDSESEEEARAPKKRGRK